MSILPMINLEINLLIWLNTRRRKSSVFMARNKYSTSGKDDRYIDLGASRHYINSIDWYAAF